MAANSGDPACQTAADLIATFPQRAGWVDQSPLDLSEHRSQRVSLQQIVESQLILTMDRDHRSALARQHPASRPMTFTLAQASRLAQVITEALREQKLPPGAPAIPQDASARFAWFVDELSAARGTIATPAAQEARPWHPDDIPDPHVLGSQLHAETMALIEEYLSQIMISWAEVRKAATIATLAE